MVDSIHILCVARACISLSKWRSAETHRFNDAGAYTLGHVLAWIALLLMNRHPEISPLALLLIFVWPITDMLLSMLRRKNLEDPSDSQIGCIFIRWSCVP